MSIYTLQPKDDPTAPTFSIEREHVTELRRILRDEFKARGGELSKVNRKFGGFFIKAKEAVKILDDAGFDYGAQLDATQRYWFVIFCARAIRRLSGNPRHAPKFIEVF